MLINRFEPDADPDRVGNAIARDGYAIVERAMEPALLVELEEQLHPHIDGAPRGGSAFLGDKTKRVVGLFTRSTAARQLATHPVIMAAADRILLPFCTRYQINYSGVMHLEPGQESQPLHRDGRCYPFANPAPPTVLSTTWAITDFHQGNGATQLVPGSHRWADEQQASPDQVVAAEMPAGSVVIYIGSVLHGGGANKSPEARTGVAVHYSLGWLRQVENQYLSVALEDVKSFPKQLQRLMGYDYGGPFLGMVDGDDPFRALSNGSTDAAGKRTSDELEAAHARIRKLRVQPDP